MTDQFNGLTNAQSERLAMLAEEAGEIVQAVGKILRHGYTSKHPAYLDGLNNRQMLEEELRDLLAVAQEMGERADILFNPNRQGTGPWNKKKKYTHHHEPTT